MIQNPIPSSPHYSIPLENPGLALLILEAHIRTIGDGITHNISLSSFKSNTTISISLSSWQAFMALARVHEVFSEISVRSLHFLAV